MNGLRSIPVSRHVWANGQNFKKGSICSFALIGRTGPENGYQSYLLVSPAVFLPGDAGRGTCLTMIVTVILLVALVMILQLLGSKIALALDKRK